MAAGTTPKPCGSLRMGIWRTAQQLAAVLRIVCGWGRPLQREATWKALVERGH